MARGVVPIEASIGENHGASARSLIRPCADRSQTENLTIIITNYFPIPIYRLALLAVGAKLQISDKESVCALPGGQSD
jgi:hypothetical protein